MAAELLRERGPRWVIVTIGAEGAVASFDGERVTVPVPKVEVVDTTGAGDIFRSGLIYGQLQGWRGVELLRFANAAAAVSCTRDGAIGGAPTLEDVLALLNDKHTR